MYYGYARVSTVGQSDASIDVQLKVEGKEKAKRVIWERIHNIER